MKILLKLLSIVIIVSSITLLNSCKPSEKVALKYLTVEKGAIPPDFGEKGTKLLIYSGSTHFDKKNISEFYKGDYQKIYGYKTTGFSKKKKNTFMQHDTNFKDVNKYRFVFVFEVLPGGSGTNSFTSYIIKVYDRKEKKSYRSKKMPVNYVNFAVEYLKRLDQQRISNER